MSWFSGKSRTSLRLGLGFHADGISVAGIERIGNGCRLQQCAFFPADKEDAQGDVLERLVKELGLKGASTVAVLDPGSYSLLQVEAPEVEPGELRSAIRWRIKDLLDFHIDDAVLDIFDMPESKHHSGPHLMYVVAAKAGRIQQHVDQMEAAGLDIAAIDVTELAVRNLLGLITEPEKFHGLLYLAPGYGLIEIVQGSTLFLSRRIEINARDLEEQGGFGLDELIDALVLELQRSLDYQESQFGLGAVPAISIVAPESRSEPLIALASESLSATVKALSLSDKIVGCDTVSPVELSRCLPAIGAALREG